MTGNSEAIRELLVEMNRNIQTLGRPGRPVLERNHMDWHNERCQGEILLAAERLSAHLGEHEVAQEAGFEMAEELLDMPRSTETEEARAPVQDALRAIIESADAVSEALEREEGEDDVETIQGIRDRLMKNWESLAHAAGCHLEAVKHGTVQPVVPFREIQDPFTALGVAAFHAGSAVLDFGMIQCNPGREERVELEERYAWGDRNAGTAHRVLHVINQELAERHPTHSPEIRKYARQMNIWITRERAQAAIALGMEDRPWETDDIAHHDIDRLQRQTAAEQEARAGQAEPAGEARERKVQRGRNEMGIRTSPDDREARVHQLPAGSYYIGDPGYVIRDDDWDDYLDAWFAGEEWRGKPVAAFGTKADGGFTDNLGRQYPVDAAMLAAVPMELVKDRDRALRDGEVITFPKPFRCSMDRRGRIHFGDVRIKT